MAPLTSSRSKSGFWHWLEYHYARPEFSGGMLLALAIFFFIAATNTLAGWLYVISGISIALLLINSILPNRLLARLKLQRSPLKPISAGDQFWQELQLTNTSNHSLDLIGLQDHLPRGIQPLQHPSNSLNTALNTSDNTVIDTIPAHQSYRWCYPLQVLKRGIYLFDQISLFTSTPLGLCRSSRTRSLPQILTVYPQVLPLSHCPLIDQLGLGELKQLQTWSRKPQTANQGMTKAIRPYRWGDPIRLVHWRSSAKFGELRVRELEVNPGGAEIIIGIDLDQNWRSLDFEQAVVAAASLYFYAKAKDLQVKLWTSSNQTYTDQPEVLHLLAKIQPTSQQPPANFPSQPLIWLTSNSDRLHILPANSRIILWQTNIPFAQNQVTQNQANCLRIINHTDQQQSDTPSNAPEDPAILNQDQLNRLQQLLQTAY